MAEPPSVEAVVSPVKLTVSQPLHVAATRAVGAAGRVTGMMAAEAADEEPVPLALVPLTDTV